MEDWSKKSDEQVFGTVGEDPGSRGAYWRDIEIKRRHFLLDKQVSAAQIRAAEAQIIAAEATRKTAIWTRISAIAMSLSVIAILIAARL